MKKQSNETLIEKKARLFDALLFGILYKGHTIGYYYNGGTSEHGVYIDSTRNIEIPLSSEDANDINDIVWEKIHGKK